MKSRIIAAVLIFVCLNTFQAEAQEQTFEDKVKILSEKIEDITKEERLELKIAIKRINERLEAKEISSTEAQEMKKEAANASARRIQERVATVEKELQNLIQGKVDNEIFIEKNRRRFRIGGFDVDYDRDYHWNRWHRRRYRRTQSNLVMAFGLNNLVNDDELGSIDDSEFNFWKSHFFEIGVNYKTRIFKNNGLMYLNYGWSVMYNTLRPKDNQFFEVNGDSTSLATSPIDLNKSKFKNVQLVLPVLFELDFSQPRFSESDQKMRYRTNRSVRLGAGGFVGINLKSKQVLKYKENDIKARDKQKGDFNVNNFVYGLSAFVGHRDMSFYVKYNLNELFDASASVQNNISFGLRFDL